MAPKKKILTKEEKSILIDLICKNYPRTSIAKKLKIQNSTLERICNDENIQLPKKYISTFSRKENIEGCLKINNSYGYFSDLPSLYALLFISKQYENVIFLEKQHKIYSFSSNEKKYIFEINENKELTSEMIKNAVEQKKIKFMDSYMNKKWNINYEL